MTTKTIVSVAMFLTIGLIVVAGCKKKEQPPRSPAVEDVNKHAAAYEQTICPVMAGPVNKEIFTEYKGKKVYFCCAGCKEEFEKDPEKYIAKLPQFAK
jgi:YHS domain-containing protein